MSDSPVPSAPASAPEAPEVSLPNEGSTSAGDSPANHASESPAAQFFKLMVDGEETEVDLETLKKGYSHASAANKRMQAAAAERKAASEEAAKVKEWEAKLLKNPIKALHEAGLPPAEIRKYLENGLWEFYQADQMTPEQKAAATEKKRHEQERAQLDSQRKEIEEWKAQRDAEAQEREVAKHQQEYAAQIQGAIQKHNLPLNAAVVKQLAGYMSQALEHGYELSIDQAAEIYKEEHQTTMKSFLKGLSPAQLREYLGDEGVKQFRSEDVAALKNPPKTQKKPAASPSKGSDRPSARSFFDSLK